MVLNLENNDLEHVELKVGKGLKLRPEKRGFIVQLPVVTEGMIVVENPQSGICDQLPIQVKQHFVRFQIERAICISERRKLSTKNKIEIAAANIETSGRRCLEAHRRYHFGSLPED